MYQYKTPCTIKYIAIYLNITLKVNKSVAQQTMKSSGKIGQDLINKPEWEVPHPWLNASTKCLE